MAKKTTDTTEQLLNTIVEALQEKKGQEITTIDLRGIENTICNHFVICQAQSTTQVSALADNVQRLTYIQLETEPRHIEGRANAFWVLLDYFDIVVHIFLAEYRQFYSIEELWSDGVVKKIVEPVVMPALVKEGSKAAKVRAARIESKLKRQAEQIENAEKLSVEERNLMAEALLTELKGDALHKKEHARPYDKKTLGTNKKVAVKKSTAKKAGTAPKSAASKTAKSKAGVAKKATAKTTKSTKK